MTGGPSDAMATLNREPLDSRRRITADFVADSLREAIQSGAIEDGAVLKQQAVADRFDISRVPVREAMRQLSAEGLIEMRAHHIAVVRGLTLDRIAEIYDYRALIEGHLLERAVPHIPVGVVSRLRVLEQEMRTITDHSSWLIRNAEFHGAMNEYADDATGLELVAKLRARVERYVRRWGGGLHRPREAGAEHEQILDHVMAGDAAGARDAVEHHVRSTGALLVAYGRSQQADRRLTRSVSEPHV